MKSIFSGLGILSSLVFSFSVLAQETEDPNPASHSIPENTAAEGGNGVSTEAQLPDEALNSVNQYFLFLLQEASPTLEETRKKASVSPYIGESRQKQLRNFQAQMKEWLTGREITPEGKFNMEVAADRVNGNMAAAVITLSNADNILDVGIIPVMFYRGEDRWQVAPFISSFDNADIPMEEGVAEQAAELRSWAAKQVSAMTPNVIRQVQERLASRIDAIRKEKGLYSASPAVLLGEWIKAMKKEDVMAVAAIGEIYSGSEQSLADRLKQSAGFVRRAGKAKMELPLTFLLSSSSALVVIMDEKPDRVSLGILDMEFNFPSQSVGMLLNFGTKKLPDNKGLGLIYPKECSPSEQLMITSGRGMDDAELEKMINRILQAYVSKLPDTRYEDPQQLADKYIEAAGRDTVSMNEFLGLMEKENLENNKSFERIKGLWNTNRSVWEYKQRMTNQHGPEWREKSVKLSRLVPLDDNNTLLLLTWFSPVAEHHAYGIHTVLLKKTDKGWIWDLAPEGDIIPKITKEKSAFNVFVKEEYEKARLQSYTRVPLDKLPPVPDAPIKKEEIKDADESLKTFLRDTFNQEKGVEKLMESREGVIIGNDTEIPDWTGTWTSLKIILQDESGQAFEEGSRIIPEKAPVWAAVQYNDWGALALAFRTEKASKLFIMPVVKLDGKWNLLHTSIHETGEKLDIYKPKIKKNARADQSMQTLVRKWDDILFIPMMEVLINKKMLHPSVYAMADKAKEEKGQKEENK